MNTQKCLLLTGIHYMKSSCIKVEEVADKGRRTSISRGFLKACMYYAKKVSGNIILISNLFTSKHYDLK